MEITLNPLFENGFLSVNFYFYNIKLLKSVIIIIQTMNPHNLNNLITRITLHLLFFFLQLHLISNIQKVF